MNPKTLAEAINMLADLKTQIEAKDAKIAELEASGKKSESDALGFVAEADKAKSDLAIAQGKISALETQIAGMFTTEQLTEANKSAITAALAAQGTPPVDEPGPEKGKKKGEKDKEEEEADEEDEEKQAVKGLTGTAKAAAAWNYKLKGRK